MGGLPFSKIINIHSREGYVGFWGLSLHTIPKYDWIYLQSWNVAGTAAAARYRITPSAFSFASCLICLHGLTSTRSEHLPDRLTASSVRVKVLLCLLEWQSVCVCVFVGLTLAVAQVLDLDAFLLLTGRLLHLAGVVIGTTVWCTHRVEADVGTIDVANTPAEQEIMAEW